MTKQKRRDKDRDKMLKKYYIKKKRRRIYGV